MQGRAQPQPAGLGEPCLNLPAGATSPRTVPWDSEPVSQEPWSSAVGQLNLTLLVPVGRSPACCDLVLQSLCCIGVCHKAPEQQLR